MKTPSTHPLLPLFCQHFFVYYLKRVSNTQSSSGIRSIGKRFFENTTILDLKEMKLLLHEARDKNYKLASSYQAELVNPEKRQVPREESELLTCKKEFHDSLVRLYHAFILWLDAPRLQESSLVISDLPENYEPARLSNVLTGDTEPWLSFMDITKLQEDLDKQLNSWHCYNKYSEVVSPCLDIKLKNESPEQHILHKLGSYNASKAAPAVRQSELPIPVITEEIFNSKDIIMNTIEKDLKVLQESIDWFSSKISNIKQLDEVYHNSLVQLYQDVDTKVSYRVSCNKGDEGTPGGCSGAAIIFLSVKEKEIDEKIKQEIDKNRIEHHILMSELLKPLRPSFYSAAAHMTNCLKKLSEQAARERDRHNLRKYNELCKMGHSLFFYLIKCFDCSINNFVTTRALLTEQLQLLFLAFMQDESQSIQLLELLATHQHVESLLPVLKLFNPMTHSGKNFVQIYESLVDMIYKLPLNVNQILIDKFDISAWLNDKRFLSEGRRLIDALGRALSKISQQLNGTDLIYKVYERHMVVLLLHNFPDYYGDILCMLLSGTDSLSIPKEAWVAFMRSFRLFLNSEMAFDCKEILQQYATKQTLLPAQQAAETLQLLERHFWKAREVNKVNLYEKYIDYLPSIVNVFTMMSHVSIYTDQVAYHDPNEFVEEIVEFSIAWDRLRGAFEPWFLSTIEQSPWLPSNNDQAVLMLKSYTMCICSLEEKIKERHQGESILPTVWRHYVEMFGHKNVKDYVRITAQEAFASLKWNEFIPELEDIELMIQLAESKLPDNVNFTSNIFGKIPWMEIKYLSAGTGETASTNILPILIKLIVKLAWEPAIVEAGTLPQILRAAEAFSWHLVNEETLRQVVDTFLEKCDPQCILHEQQNGSMDALLLRFLRISTCMEPLELLQKYPETLHHRLLFVKTCVQLLIRCSVSKPALLTENKDLYLRAVHNILQQIDVSTAHNVSPPDHFKHRVKMIGHFLVILADAPQAELRDLVIRGITKWFEEKPTSPLVLSCIQASCRSINCMPYLVKIVECCIAQYFYASREMPVNITCLLRYLSISELYEDEFLAACCKSNNHFCQYIYLEQKLLESRNHEDASLLNMLVNWNEQATPQLDSEAKVILLWDRILSLSVRQIDADNEAATKEDLLRFIKKLDVFAGKESSWLSFMNKPLYQVTAKFRFLSRFLASFVAVQIPLNGSIRVSSYTEGHIVHNGASSPTTKEKKFSDTRCEPSHFARGSVKQLEALLKQKQYSGFKDNIEEAVNLVMDANNHLGDSRTFLRQFATSLYDIRCNKFLGLLNK